MKKIIAAVSFILNIIFLLLLLSLLALEKPESFAFYAPADHSAGPAAYAAAACIVSYPQGADVSLSPPELTLRAGDRAGIQFSAVRDRRQTNLGIEALYDRSIISVERSGYGLVVHALKPGETMMQIFAESGVRDVAFITVLEKGPE
jgi:hypothetical protein